MTPNDRREWLKFLGELHALCERHSVGMLGGQFYRRLPAHSATRLGTVTSGSQGAQATAWTMGQDKGAALTWDSPDAAMGHNAEPEAPCISCANGGSPHCGECEGRGRTYGEWPWYTHVRKKAPVALGFSQPLEVKGHGT